MEILLFSRSSSDSVQLNTTLQSAMAGHGPIDVDTSTPYGPSPPPFTRMAILGVLKRPGTLGRKRQGIV